MSLPLPAVLVNLAVVTNVVPYIISLSALLFMMQAAGVTGGKYQTSAAIALVGMLYSVYAIYASGKDAVMGGTLVLALGYVIAELSMTLAEAVGPLVTLTVWVMVIVALTWRDVRRDRHASWVELVPFVSGVVILQLLLDLLVPHLGDLAIGTAHVVGLVIGLVRRRRAA